MSDDIPTPQEHLAETQTEERDARATWAAARADLASWLRINRIEEVECMVPDMNGVMRGKLLPATKFLKMYKDGTIRIATSVLTVAITGDYPDDEDITSSIDPDVVLLPDKLSIRVAPGYKTPTAFLMTDPMTHKGQPVDLAPRQVLKNVIKLYTDRGWKPVVAPELEFFLTKPNIDPDLPLESPVGRSGRSEGGNQPYGLEAINEYEDLIDRIYDDCEIAQLDVDTMIHEAGAAQLEVNFNHGDPLALADQVVIFKRLVRQIAIQHGIYATFMAKPMATQPGSAMHMHQSVVHLETGRNLFATANGRDSVLFKNHVAGLQRLLPQLTPLFAPNVNSYRRMLPDFAAPINVHWGVDNRTCGLRVPNSDGQNRRIENRLPGADANPYLAFAASLMAGYIGMVERMQPRPQVTGNAYRLARTLPRTLEEALSRFTHCKPAKKYLGEAFVRSFAAIKRMELEAYQGVISSWEREHLLLRV